MELNTKFTTKVGRSLWKLKIWWDQSFLQDSYYGDFRDLFIANLDTAARLEICKPPKSINKKDWHGCGTYPTDFSKFIEKPAKPSEEIDLPEERIRLSNNSVSFVIVDVYRCTFTVGRKQYSLFKFSTGAIENYTSPNRTYQEYPQCVECAIGGYCAGGCKLSSDVDFERMCSTEAADFMDFLNTLFYPEIRKKLSTQEIVF